MYGRGSLPGDQLNPRRCHVRESGGYTAQGPGDEEETAGASGSWAPGVRESQGFTSSLPWSFSGGVCCCTVPASPHCSSPKREGKAGGAAAIHSAEERSHHRRTHGTVCGEENRSTLYPMGVQGKSQCTNQTPGFIFCITGYKVREVI